VSVSELSDHDPGNPEPDGTAAFYREYRPVSAEVAIALTVSVVIPVKNEAANLPHVFATIPHWVDEVVLVDGRSTDRTVEIARQLRPDLKVITQSGAGKGDALLAGFAVCTGDIIVAMDGDGSTHGAEIIQFVTTLTAGADFVKGSRFASGGGSDDITASRRLGNRALLTLVNRFYRTQYTDLCYGYNAFWSRHLTALAMDCDGFEVEALMSIRAAKAGLRIHEVASHERPRLHGASNLRSIRDGWRILRVILRERTGGVVSLEPGYRPITEIGLGQTGLGQTGPVGLPAPEADAAPVESL
jgi:glycosyltransferase involved in cell wall biosynthesis